MGSSDLLPEKFAMYFSSMNPLASKIYADVEGVEDYIKSHGPPTITYNEKCSIVDKFLIYDHLHKNDANGKLNKKLTNYHQKYQFNKSEISLNSLLDNDKEEVGLISETELLQPVYYNDSTLDQDHETILLTSVAPKKPEKYVYDGDNNDWIDEHSVPYSSCTETQAKCCKLQQFLDSLPPPPQQTHRRHDHHHPQKYRAPPIPTHVRSDEDDDENDDLYIIKPNKGKGLGKEDHDRFSRIDKMDRENSKNAKPASSASIRVPLFGGMLGGGDDPQPITGTKAAAEVSNEEDLPNQVQNKDLIAELQAKLKKGNRTMEKSGVRNLDGISPRSSTKSKPKAPPPPPPSGGSQVKPPGGAVKITKASEKTEKKEKENEGKQQKSLQREISDDFVVDISSPCKIATPKTGLDFLDNW